mmetsp:Transcript_17091/g.65149  ORF Transcript_17091/g.65149 Transcript_17091/m.65149 type:complete len:200 (-) Transcript_17091:99-698(-)
MQLKVLDQRVHLTDELRRRTGLVPLQTLLRRDGGRVGLRFAPGESTSHLLRREVPAGLHGGDEASVFPRTDVDLLLRSRVGVPRHVRGVLAGVQVRPDEHEGVRRVRVDAVLPAGSKRRLHLHHQLASDRVYPVRLDRRRRLVDDVHQGAARRSRHPEDASQGQNCEAIYEKRSPHASRRRTLFGARLPTSLHRADQSS